MTPIAVHASREPYRQHLDPIAELLELPVIETQREARAFDAGLWLVASHHDFIGVGRDRRRVMMEHGCGLEWYPRAKLLQLRQATAFAAPNEFIASRYRTVLPRARIEVVGTPKLDRLLSDARFTNHDSRTVAVSFHWSGVRGQRRPSLQRWRQAILELAATVPVLGHAHPRIWTEADAFYTELGIEPVREFGDVVRRAGVYVCDHSSTIYEWTALGRSVVLMNRAGVVMAPPTTGLRYDELADVGPEASPETLVDVVHQVLEHDAHGPQRAAATAALYPHLGSATARVASLLQDLS